MKILISLSEVLNRCDNWEDFCNKKGYDVYCVANFGGELEVELTEEEAIEYGIINPENK